VTRALLLLALLLGFDLKAELQAQYDRWTKAYMAYDTDTLDDILAPDYVLVNVKKEPTTREKYMAYLKLRKELKQDTVKYSSKVKKVELKDDKAIAQDIETQESIVDGKRVLHRHEYRDTWTKIEGKWKLQKTETIKETTEVKPQAKTEEPKT